MSKFYCLIPARGGSKGIPRKNIKILNGIPLIAHSILCAKKSKLFEEVYVSTDDIEISEIAKKYGANIPFLRNPNLAGDKTHMFKVYKELVLRIPQLSDDDVLMVLLPTNPLRKVSDIELVKNEFEKNSSTEWVFTCNEMEHNPFRAVRINEKNQNLEPFFPIENKLMWSNRQELPKAYRFNGAIIAGKIASIRNNEEYPIDSYRYKNTLVKGVISSSLSSLDIDTENDFNFINSILASS